MDLSRVVWFFNRQARSDCPIELLRVGRLRVWIYRPWCCRRFTGNLEFQWGPGAGYIGGWTAFVALRMRASHWPALGRRQVRLLQVGITRNGNRVPCSD